MIRSSYLGVWVALAAAGAGCSSDEGGSSATTGGSSATTGGSSATTGGSSATTGGSSATTGGSSATGGTAGGTGGGSGAGGGSAGASAGSSGLPADVPTDLTQSGIQAFLAATNFDSWTWDTDTPRPPGRVSPHGEVRVAINKTLVDSIAAGDDGSANRPFAAGSMALKQMYEGDAVAGRAFILKRAATNTTPSWLYYCEGDAGRCGVESATPFFATGNTFSACNVCHYNYFFIGIPED